MHEDDERLRASVNKIIALIIFAVAAFAILSTQQPLLIKTVLVIVAWFTALHWLNDYMPRTARLIGKLSLLFLFEMVKAVAYQGSGRRR